MLINFQYNQAAKWGKMKGAPLVNKIDKISPLVGLGRWGGGPIRLNQIMISSSVNSGLSDVTACLFRTN